MAVGSSEVECLIQVDIGEVEITQDTYGHFKHNVTPSLEVPSYSQAYCPGRFRLEPGAHSVFLLQSLLSMR